MNGLTNSEYESLSFKGDSPFLYMPPRTLISGIPLSLRWHEQMEIKYILSGTLDVVCGSKVVRAKPGDVVIVNPCERHANQAPNESVAYHLLMVNLSADTLGTGFQEYMDGAYGFENLIRNDSTITDLLQKIVDAVSMPTPTSMMRANGWFHVLFSHLCESYLDTRYSAVGSNNLRQARMAETTIEYIYKHYHQEIRLKDIAAQCYVTEAHLCRIFKEVTGKPPVTYLMEFRINKAAIFLENTDLSVSEIAEQVGFRNSSYFCRCFRKLKGETPDSYRKSNRLCRPD